MAGAELDVVYPPPTATHFVVVTVGVPIAHLLTAYS